MNQKYTIIDLFHKKTTSTRSYICNICGEEHRQFNNRLLHKHNITRQEYIEMYGYPNSFYEKDDILNSLIEQINKLYISNRYKWLVLSGFNHQYYTKDTHTIKTTRDNTTSREIPVLTNQQIKDHLKGKNTIGVFPDGQVSKFLIFDIDSYSGLHVAQGVATAILEFLLKFFQETAIHIVYTGKKGFHITLFFNEPVKISDLHRLFIITVNVVNFDLFDNFAIEMRPTLNGVDGHGVKLPLGVNFTSSDNYNNYAYFVGHNFREIDNQIDYVLNIVQSKGSIVNQIINTHDSPDYVYIDETYSKTDDTVNVPIKDTPDYNSNSSPYRDFRSVETILENGLTSSGTRHHWSFLIAMYLKQLGFDEKEVYNRLMNWSLQQVEQGYSTSSVREIEKDVSAIVYNGVFSSSKDYNLPLIFNRDQSINLYESDFKKLEKINQIAQSTGKSHISTQKVYFAILVHSQIYNTRYREFHMRYTDIMYLSGLNSRKTIKKCIDQLSSMKFIDIIKRDLRYNPKIGFKEANLYLIIHDSHDSNVEFSFASNRIFEYNLFFNVINQNYSDSNLKNIFTTSVIRKLRKAS